MKALHFTSQDKQPMGRLLGKFFEQTMLKALRCDSDWEQENLGGAESASLGAPRAVASDGPAPSSSSYRPGNAAGFKVGVSAVCGSEGSSVLRDAVISICSERPRSRRCVSQASSVPAACDCLQPSVFPLSL